MWIDALCVNQEDIQERNFQVALMDRIHNNAARVVVCLGEESKDSKVAIEGLKRLPSSADDQILEDEGEGLDIGLDFPEYGCCRRLSCLIGQSCFCGTDMVNLVEVTRFVEWFGDRVNINFDFPYVLRLGNIQISKPTVSEALIDLLFGTRHCGSTDPRDKVFALLPMLPLATEEVLSADYLENTASVFTNIATYLLKTEGFPV
jgi:hypothetical protein